MKRLILFLLAFLAVAGACQADGDDKGFIVLPGMHDSIPYDAYDPHPVIGQTQRHPPEGTLPHGATRYRYGPGRDEALRAGRELSNPIPLDADALTRGKQGYDTFCLVCHGPGGRATGPCVDALRHPTSWWLRQMPSRRGACFTR